MKINKYFFILILLIIYASGVLMHRYQIPPLNHLHKVMLYYEEIRPTEIDFIVKNVKKVSKKMDHEDIILDEGIIMRIINNLDYNQNKKENIIKFYKSSYGQKVIFYTKNNNIISDYKIIFETDIKLMDYNEDKDKNLRVESCILFNNVEIKNLSIEVINSNCNDAINFKLSNGSIDKIKINNAIHDGLDIDHSKISFKDVYINFAGKECIDVSNSNVSFDKILFINCATNALQLNKSISVVNNFSSLYEIND